MVEFHVVKPFGVFTRGLTEDVGGAGGFGRLFAQTQLFLCLFLHDTALLVPEVKNTHTYELDLAE